MAETWSPRCPTCTGRGNAEVTPPSNMIFAGRLRPEATKPFVAGSRVRCTKCMRWFTVGAGTEWRLNPAGSIKPHVADRDDDAGQGDLNVGSDPRA